MLWNKFSLNNKWHFWILQICWKLYQVHRYVSKSSSSRNFEKFLLTVVALLESTEMLLKMNSISANYYNYQPFIVSQLPENSWDDVCSGIPFYTSRCWHILLRKAALNRFLENSKEGLQVYLKRTPTWMFRWRVSKNFQSPCFS